MVDGAVGRLAAKPGGGAFFADPHQTGGASRLTLVGFARAGRHNVYAHPHRLTE